MRRSSDQRYNLGETGLLKQFAVCPYTNKIILRQSSASDDIDMTGTDDRPVTFEDVIRMLKENVDDLDLEGYYFDGMEWVYGTTFPVSHGS